MTSRHDHAGDDSADTELDQVIEDAALLAAIAADGCLVASQAFRACLADDPRVHSAVLTHPLLANLQDGDGRAVTLSVEDTRQQALLARQAGALIG